MVLLIIVFIIIAWAALSTIYFKITSEIIDDESDPRVLIGTLFSPIGILILTGYGIALLILRRLKEFVEYITNQLKNEDGD